MPSYTGNELLQSIHHPINKTQHEILLAELKHKQQREKLEFLEQFSQRLNKEETKCDDFASSNGHHHKSATTNWAANQQRNGTSAATIGGRIAVPNANNLPTAPPPSILPMNQQQLYQQFWLNSAYYPTLQNHFLANPPNPANIQPNLLGLFDQKR